MILSIGRERPDPATLSSPLLGDGDVLSFARRIEGHGANAMGGGIFTQLHRRSGSGSKGLPQPGAGLVNDGVPSGTSTRGVRLRVEQLSGGPHALPVPDETRHARAGDGREAKGEGGRGTGEIAFGHGQDAPLGVGGIGGEEESGAGGADDADAAQTP